MNKIIKTKDGSHTIMSDKFEVLYHSSFGAIQESRHIFIDSGLKCISEKSKNVSILEMGFGTGLNALLTAIEAEESEITIDYIGIEAYPLGEDVASNLNFHEFIKHKNAKEYLMMMHRNNELNTSLIHPNFSFQLIIAQIELLSLKSESFDLIYFDAFDPEVQPNLWDKEIFSKIYKATKKGGVLLTYSCKGIVKRALKSAGFTIEKLPGPIGKREILRATKK